MNEMCAKLQNLAKTTYCRFIFIKNVILLWPKKFFQNRKITITFNRSCLLTEIMNPVHQRVKFRMVSHVMFKPLSKKNPK